MNEFVLTQQHRLILLGASLVLTCILLGYALLTWYGDWQLSHAPLPAFQLPRQNANVALVEMLPEQHLFGQGLTPMGEMPISNLELRVMGISKGMNENSTSSQALIAIAGGASKVYKIGDALPDGVKIYAIAADAVVLENDGRLEKLPLPREALVFKPRHTLE